MNLTYLKRKVWNSNMKICATLYRNFTCVGITKVLSDSLFQQANNKLSGLSFHHEPRYELSIPVRLALNGYFQIHSLRTRALYWENEAIKV